jgi:hypothetical protein
LQVGAVCGRAARATYFAALQRDLQQSPHPMALGLENIVLDMFTLPADVKARAERHRPVPISVAAARVVRRRPSP